MIQFNQTKQKWFQINHFFVLFFFFIFFFIAEVRVLNFLLLYLFFFNPERQHSWMVCLSCALYCTAMNLHFLLAWGLFISLLVWKGLNICKKRTFFLNKQASPVQVRKSNAKVTHYFPKKKKVTELVTFLGSNTKCT